jgi:hypothetical protein
MDLDGTVEKNLISAIRSAKRLRRRPVHGDTIEHWTYVLRRAEAELLSKPSPEREALADLVSDLRAELEPRTGRRTA